MSDAGWDEPQRDEDVVDPLIGRVLGSRYRIEALLGKGAMGAVYRARHVKVGRPFAVKVLHERLLIEPKLRKRFEREAELAGKLHHINVIGVVDVGETEDGIHFMVMEFAEGQTLGSLVDGPMDARRVINLAQQLCDGLQHAHEHGLIHRDFKPENVIVEKDRFGNERPRIVDFGIAILRDDAEDPQKKDRLTTAGLVLGTPHYMAPEHAMGAGIDHRIDLFALGVILYELLTGSLPFDGDGVDVARANLIAPTPPMGVRVPGVVVDPLLEAFTRQLMQKKPADRPESAKAARHLLDLIERDRPMAARILGVVLADPVAATTASAATSAATSAASMDTAMAGATAPSSSGTTSSAPPLLERAHPPVSADTPPPYRAMVSSTPSSRADTVPERGPARSAPSSLSMGAIPSQSMEPVQRSRATLFAVFGGAIAIAAVLVVVATRGSTESSSARGSAVASALATDPVPAQAAGSSQGTDTAPTGSSATTTQPNGNQPTGSSATTTQPNGNQPTGTSAPTAPPNGDQPTATSTTAQPNGNQPTGPTTTQQNGTTTGTSSTTTQQNAKPTGTSSSTNPTGRPTGTRPTGTNTTATNPTGTRPPTTSSPTTNPTGTRPSPTSSPATQNGSKPAGTPTAKPGTPTAPDTSSSAVANLYGAVGRELKALDTKRGADVAQPMWQRFRVLRINDALQTPEKRAAAERVLSQLRRDIAAAM